MENATSPAPDRYSSMPDEIRCALDPWNAWPDGVHDEEVAFSKSISGIPAVHRDIIDKAGGSMAYQREDFMYLVGVGVGKALADGQDVGDLEAELIVAWARETYNERVGGDA